MIDVEEGLEPHSTVVFQGAAAGITQHWLSRSAQRGGSAAAILALWVRPCTTRP